MDLSTDFMGLELPNPLILSSGPLSSNGEMILRALDYGLGAVVTETILNEIRPNVRPRLVNKGEGLHNIWLYSELTLEDWEREIGMVKEAGGTVIANILAYTPSEMAFLARKMESFGADAIELGLSSPHGEGIEIIASHSEENYELVKSVVESVGIPVMVKLSANVTNIARIAQAVEEAGAQGISAINTLRSISGVDLEKQEPLLPTYGGYSGEPIRPIGLAAVAAIKHTVDLPVSGIGGITDFRHMLEYLMLGADTCQLQTAVMLHGYRVIPEILESLEAWMDEHSCTDFSQIRGSALPKLKAFDEIIFEQKVAKLVKSCPRPSCELCVISCLYNGIDKTEGGGVEIDTSLCSGCGLCVSICPENCFVLQPEEDV